MWIVLIPQIPFVYVNYVRFWRYYNINPCVILVGWHVVNLSLTYVQPGVGCLYQLALTRRQVDSVALGTSIPCWCVIRYFIAVLVMLILSSEAKTKPQMNSLTLCKNKHQSVFLPEWEINGRPQIYKLTGKYWAVTVVVLVDMVKTVVFNSYRSIATDIVDCLQKWCSFLMSGQSIIAESWHIPCYFSLILVPDISSHHWWCFFLIGIITNTFGTVKLILIVLFF